MKELVRSRKNSLVFILLILASLFFAARTVMTGYDLFRVILAGSGWNFFQSAEMIRFLEWLFPLLGILGLFAILLLRTPAKIFLIPFLLFTTFAGSIITLQSEALGIETHGWQTLRAAWVALVLECLILPIFVLVLLFSSWKKRKKR